MPPWPRRKENPMPEQPFKPEDVLCRLPKDEYSFARVFVKDGSQPFGIAMHWQVGDRWCPTQPTMQDAELLLRQLRAEREKNAPIRAAYEQHQHLDHLLSDPDWIGNDAINKIARDLWLAVKAVAEGGGK